MELEKKMFSPRSKTDQWQMKKYLSLSALSPHVFFEASVRKGRLRSKRSCRKDKYSNKMHLQPNKYA